MLQLRQNQTHKRGSKLQQLRRYVVWQLRVPSGKPLPQMRCGCLLNRRNRIHAEAFSRSRRKNSAVVLCPISASPRMREFRNKTIPGKSPPPASFLQNNDSYSAIIGALTRTRAAHADGFENDLQRTNRCGTKSVLIRLRIDG